MTSIIPRVGGIYQWRQLSTGRKYYGGTCDLWRRNKEHRSELNKGRHNNPRLSKAWAEKGPNDFVFTVLEVIEDTATLIEREQWYLDHAVAWGFDFNINRIAGRPYRGQRRKASEETKRRLSLSHMGYVMPEEQKQKISRANKGKKLSETQKAKLSKAKTGKVQTEAARKKNADAHKGKKLGPHSEEHKSKIAETLLGHFVSKETRQKLADAILGKKRGPYKKRSKTK